MHAHPTLDLAGLTGCRVGGIPLGSSEHLGPGLAGCRLRHLCGWCSDATHKRGPRVEEQGQNSVHHLSKPQLPLPPALRLPATTSSQCTLPAAHLQTQPSVCLPLRTTVLLSGVRGRWIYNPLDPVKGKQGFIPSLRHQTRSLHKAQPEAQPRATWQWS